MSLENIIGKLLCIKLPESDNIGISVLQLKEDNGANKHGFLTASFNAELDSGSNCSANTNRGDLVWSNGTNPTRSSALTVKKSGVADPHEKGCVFETFNSEMGDGRRLGFTASDLTADHYFYNETLEMDTNGVFVDEQTIFIDSRYDIVDKDNYNSNSITVAEEGITFRIGTSTGVSNIDITDRSLTLTDNLTINTTSTILTETPNTYIGKACLMSRNASTGILEELDITNLPQYDNVDEANESLGEAGRLWRPSSGNSMNLPESVIMTSY